MITDDRLNQLWAIAILRAQDREHPDRADWLDMVKAFRELSERRG